MNHGTSFDELDHLSLVQRQKMLLENKHPLLEDGSKIISPLCNDFIVKEEDECCDVQGVSSMISTRDDGNLGGQQLETQMKDTSGHLEDSYTEEARLNTEKQISCTMEFENPTPPEVPDWVRVESTGILSGTLEDGVDNFTSAGVAVTKVKNEMFDDFNEDLDHVVFIERLRMLLSRKALGSMNQHVEGGSGASSGDPMQCFLKQKGKSMFSNVELTGTRNVLHDQNGCDAPHLGSPSVVCSPIATISGSNFSSNRSLNKLTESGNDMELKEDDRICLSEKVTTELGSRLLTNHAPEANLFYSTKVKDEPYDHVDGCNLHGKDMNNVCSRILSVKSETTMPDEPYENKVDDMRLQDRMKFFSSRKVFGSTSRDYEHPKPSDPGCSSLVSEPASLMNVKRRRKWKRTATNSIETALEEDAPGLLQILVDKGVLVDEIKLYGEMESDDDLDESFSEESFGELEAVISRLFSQRDSFLKFPPIRCTKASRSSYCLACLVSLIEQTRYLHFRSWPVEWGWCRDLQSFIFVFERHKRIVLERPEYGYATYFFELVNFLPIKWQIKRLVIALKLTNCSRISLLENRPLLVGEDLTEGEAGVLSSYGWLPNSGLGSMLNYCDRVVHDRNHEDISEWRSKIGKLLVDGYNGGALVQENIPKQVAEYRSSQTTQLKLEL
ncbi:uncharacterized protein LOC111011878 isoform X2 [Momordica charantia]|uniref:Uncharacterized protein LOC111011878 isoform X2 n=1 Tax=Momordica charantia TaxID=3673 RepID=A0A6J1CIB2_MOMCH|nr:uncharacterized protein LOC111011878 isoform X2 [Momordica charantia]